MPDLLTVTVAHLTTAWRTEAAHRRAISRVDPIADTLEYCAVEMDERLRDVALEIEYLNAEEYADQPHIRVTAQSVRNWIRAGQLPAIQGPKGWLIPKGATRMVNGNGE